MILRFCYKADRTVTAFSVACQPRAQMRRRDALAVARGRRLGQTDRRDPASLAKLYQADETGEELAHPQQPLCVLVAFG
jgi:hypothetical protein